MKKTNVPTRKEMEAFVIELEGLSRKHRIYIGGCGCCGSPYFRKMSEQDATDQAGGYAILDGDGDLTWLNQRDFENYSDGTKPIKKSTNQGEKIMTLAKVSREEFLSVIDGATIEVAFGRIESSVEDGEVILLADPSGDSVESRVVAITETTAFISL